MKNKIESIKSFLSKNKKGSILAYSLIVVSVMIAIVASLSVVTVIEKKGAVSTDSSVQAYQVADSGVQLAIKKINKIISDDKADETKIEDLFTDCGNFGFTDGGAGKYKLAFFDNEGGTGTALGCNVTIDKIRNIKSVGEYKDTVRAVQVAVAATTTLSSKVCQCGGSPGFFQNLYAYDWDASECKSVCDTVCPNHVNTRLLCVFSDGTSSAGTLTVGNVVPTSMPSPNCGW